MAGGDHHLAGIADRVVDRLSFDRNQAPRKNPEPLFSVLGQFDLWRGRLPFTPPVTLDGPAATAAAVWQNQPLVLSQADTLQAEARAARRRVATVSAPACALLEWCRFRGSSRSNSSASNNRWHEATFMINTVFSGLIDVERASAQVGLIFTSDCIIALLDLRDQFGIPYEASALKAMRCPCRRSRPNPSRRRRQRMMRRLMRPIALYQAQPKPKIRRK